MLKQLSRIPQYLSELQSERDARLARPIQGQPDYKGMRERALERFSKTLAYLADPTKPAPCRADLRDHESDATAEVPKQTGEVLDYLELLRLCGEANKAFRGCRHSVFDGRIAVYGSLIGSDRIGYDLTGYCLTGYADIKALQRLFPKKPEARYQSKNFSYP